MMFLVGRLYGWTKLRTFGLGRELAMDIHIIVRSNRTIKTACLIRPKVSLNYSTMFLIQKEKTFSKKKMEKECQSDSSC